MSGYHKKTPPTVKHHPLKVQKHPASEAAKPGAAKLGFKGEGGKPAATGSGKGIG